MSDDPLIERIRVLDLTSTGALFITCPRSLSDQDRARLDRLLAPLHQRGILTYWLEPGCEIVAVRRTEAPS